jgi:uncharacterized membrane protein
VKHAARGISLAVVVACVAGTMALGVASKSPCARGTWDDQRQYRLWCYTDVVPLLVTEQLEGSRLPFLDACAEAETNCDEYPVLSMYLMRAAAWVSGLAPDQPNYAAFFYVNAVLLTALATITAIWLWMLVGRRALWFALAPTLLLYGTVNWDLLAVALATGALVAFAARREEWAGVSLGLGAAAKLYPGLLVLPLFLQGLRDRDPDRSVRILWWSAGAWIAVNLPFAIVAPRSWVEFFRFNGARPADFDSLWYIVDDRWEAVRLSVRIIDVGSVLLFVGGLALVWWARSRRGPFPPWTLGFPILVVFLLTNKVYSPQYGLWLLPWFALTIPSFRVFALFELADIAVFLTRFRFFGDYVGEPWGWPESWFQIALVVRAAVLVVALVSWVRAEGEPLEIRYRLRARAPADTEAVAA